jgi:2-keto-4-pentenoate hydratase/2-oxohepta-3-ene-1,7-dioic acid hydratase in catechol pathway
MRASGDTLRAVHGVIDRFGRPLDDEGERKHERRAELPGRRREGAHPLRRGCRPPPRRERAVHLVSFERAARSAQAPASIGAAGLGFEALEGVTQGARRLGALLTAGSRAGCVVDLNRALAVKLAAEDAGAPEAEANSLLPADALAFLRRWPEAEAAAREVLAWVERTVERYDAPDLLAAGVVTPRRKVRLAAPVPRPGKVVAALSNPAPAAPGRPQPALFLQAPLAVCGPEDELRLRAGEERTVFEAGLAAVVGGAARELPPERALDHLVGYCVAIDFFCGDASASADLLARSRDASTAIGPALVTRDEISDPQDLGVRAQLSREPLRALRTKELSFSLAELLACASRRVTLEPGDLLLCGGVRCEPARALRDGDVVEVEIERVGKLVVYVRAAGSGT